METPQFIIAGKLQRDYFITADEKTVLDVLGGNLPYAAVGFKIWEDSPPPGLMARVGEDFPYRWLTDLESRGFDIRGINILPEAVDVRNFYIYTDKATRVTGDPVPHFARLGESFPKALLGYRDQSNALDSKTSMIPVSLRQGDIPEDFFVRVIFWANNNDRHVFVDQRDRPVFHLRGGISLRVNVRDLL